MRKVLIAGCGYVGGQLARGLSASGRWEVHGLRRSAVAADARDAVVWHRGDLVTGSLDGLPAKVDAVVYAAAPGERSVEAYEAIYVRGLARVLGKYPCRVILTSSTAVYAQNAGEWVDEESVAEPTAATAKIVRAGERLLRDGDVAVRLGGLYGPGRTSLLESVRRGQAVVEGAGGWTNRIHGDDAAGFLAHLLEMESVLGVYNGVDDEPALRRDVLRWMAESVGGAVKEEPGTKTGDGNKRVRNLRLRETGYELRYPSFREGYRALAAGTSV